MTLWVGVTLWVRMALGLRPGHVMAWLEPDGKMQRLKVLQVTNPPPADDSGPSAA